MAIYNEAQLSSYVDQIFARLQRMEDFAREVSEATGVAFADPAADAPPEVVELARSGDRMGAITKYRELTGAGLAEAQEVVAAL